MKKIDEGMDGALIAFIAAAKPLVCAPEGWCGCRNKYLLERKLTVAWKLS
jgi:hypothetical protein